MNYMQLPVINHNYELHISTEKYLYMFSIYLWSHK